MTGPINKNDRGPAFASPGGLLHRTWGMRLVLARRASEDLAGTLARASG